MITINMQDVCKCADSVRSDIIAKVIGRLGLEKEMFETSNAKNLGVVNFFVDHSQLLDLECLREGNLGKNHKSVLDSLFFRG
ncbi:hypothetical protein L1887_14442 [Cichorium endivia]|nr:hypothetical protein L1887_14442 [Cichorium endivia]